MRDKTEKTAVVSGEKTGFWFKRSWVPALIFITLFGGIGTWAIMRSNAASCTPDAKLVNPCRPWLGAAVDKYPGITEYDFKNQILGHETRIGRQLDIAHHYRGPGDAMSSSYATFNSRPNTYVMMNWKPVSGGGTNGTWKDAAGGNSTVDANIDKMANSVKSIAPKKIFLTLWHEPEDDVSPGGSPTCGTSLTYKGNMGTTADYVAMWKNVRARFDALGVNNVVWVHNPMGWTGWNCMVKDMWPGNNLVDWLVYDQYIHDGKAIANTTIAAFYNWLTSNSDASHDFLSKPWGLNEWSSGSTDPVLAAQGYDNLRKAVEANAYPKLKMYNVWDNYVSSTSVDWRTQYTNFQLDQTKQEAYNRFARSPYFTDEFYTASTDTEAPAVGISAPTAASTVAGTVGITANATDNKGVSKVVMYVDGVILSALTTTPYTTSWDSKTTENGNHTISAKAYDAAGNIGQSQTVTVNVQNIVTPPADTTPPSVAIVSPAEGATVNGKVSLTAVASDNVAVSKVEFYGDNLTHLKGTATSAPYSIVWDGTNATVGPQSFTAKAYDAAGNTTWSQKLTLNLVSVTTPTDTAGPNLVISQPGNGAKLSGSKATIATSATDASDVTYIGVKIDGTILAASASDALTTNWSLKRVKSGAHIITVTARDSVGNSTTKSVTVYR